MSFIEKHAADRSKREALGAELPNPLYERVFDRLDDERAPVLGKPASVPGFRCVLPVPRIGTSSAVDQSRPNGIPFKIGREGQNRTDNAKDRRPHAGGAVHSVCERDDADTGIKKNGEDLLDIDRVSSEPIQLVHDEDRIAALPKCSTNSPLEGWSVSRSPGEPGVLLQQDQIDALVLAPTSDLLSLNPEPLAVNLAGATHSNVANRVHASTTYRRDRPQPKKSGHGPVTAWASGHIRVRSGRTPRAHVPPPSRPISLKKRDGDFCQPEYRPAYVRVSEICALVIATKQFRRSS